VIKFFYQTTLQEIFFMWFNPIMVWILRSPFHRLISQSVMLVQYTGQKSGKAYAVPVNYLQRGKMLFTISQPGRTWWRNFRKGAPANLLLRGRQVPAFVQASQDVDDVAQALTDFLTGNTRYAGYLKVRLGEDGRPFPDDVRRAAAERIVIRYQLSD
jgi:hypothetical protein